MTTGPRDEVKTGSPVIEADGGQEALAEADSLVADGRALDAIDLLTEANRRDRSAAIEARLVGLRNAAYSELDRSPRPARWPDEQVRPREAGEALPAIDRDELSAERVRDRILRYGCAYIPGLFDTQTVERLVDGIDRAFDGSAAQADGASDADTAPWYARFEPPEGEEIREETRRWVHVGGGVWTVEAPRAMFDFLDALERSGLRALIDDYLGERPALTLKKSTLRRTPVLPRADWHQDGAFLGDDIRTINVWASLSHCGDDAPGLDLVPKRLDEIVPTGTGGAFFDWSVGPDTVAEVAADAPVIRPIFKPGDVLLFDELFLHRTATDEETMTRERYAIENWFFAPSLYPGDQIPFVW
jgi:hypothetical protein